MHCQKATHFRSKDSQTESEGMEKGIPCKWKSRVSCNGIIISDKIDFKIKTVTKDKKDST